MRKMSLFVTALFIGFALFMGCKKEIIRTETCFDGIQNNGETGIDCGGGCKPCQSAAGPVVPPCSPSNNTVTFSGTWGATVSTSTALGQYEVIANTANGDLYITFQNQPTVDRIYTVSPNCPTSSLGANECCVEFTSFNTYAPASGSNVYVNMVSGHPVITYCGLVFSGPVNVTSSAKITCP